VARAARPRPERPGERSEQERETERSEQERETERSEQEREMERSEQEREMERSEQERETAGCNLRAYLFARELSRHRHRRRAGSAGWIS